MAVGLLVQLEARDDKVAEVEKELKAALATVEAEEGMTNWFAGKAGPNTFVVFNTFIDDEARRLHLASELTVELRSRADDLLTEPPTILEHDVLAQTVGRRGARR